MNHNTYLLGLGITLREVEVDYLDPVDGKLKVERLTLYKDDDDYQKSHSEHTELERANQLACHALHDYMETVGRLIAKGYKMIFVQKTGDDDPEQGVVIRMEKKEGQDA